MTRGEAELRDRAVDHILKASSLANTAYNEGLAREVNAHVTVANAISNLLTAMSTVSAVSKGRSQ